MDTLKSIIAPILTGFFAWWLAVWKSGQDSDIKLAVVAQRVEALEDSLKEHKETTSMEFEKVTQSLRAATQELQTAATNIKVQTETQAIINKMTADTLRSLADRVAANDREVTEISTIVKHLDH